MMPESGSLRYYVLSYEVVEGFVARRAPLRDEHLRLVGDAHQRAELVIAGAVGEPPDGALLVFRAEGPEVAEAFARADPYVLRGLVTRWTVKPWAVVVAP